MASVNPPRGMRDFLPADKARRERVLTVIRDRYRAHGFDEIETPVMEEFGRLHSGIGGDNEKLAYNVLKRGLDAETISAAADDPASLTDLGLRYDLTVPLARFYASHRGELPPVFRAIQIAPVWRAERPQKGRYRQFVQCDIDIIGDESARAEAELIVATLDALDALGLEGGTVRVNDRRLLFGMLARFGISADDAPSALITLDKLDKVGRAGVISELHDNGLGDAAPALDRYLSAHLTDSDGIEATGVAAPVADAYIRGALSAGDPAPAAVDEATPSADGATASGDEEEAIARLVAIAQAVAAARGVEPAAVPLVFDPFLVRGMGYYTGTIFELAHPSVGYSLGGGGRYDGMIGRFLGQDVPAVGFSIGFERLVDLVESRQDAAESAVVLVHDRDVPLADLLAAKAAVLAHASRVRLEQRPKNLKALLDRASADGYTGFATVTTGQRPGDVEIKALG